MAVPTDTIAPTDTLAPTSTPTSVPGDPKLSLGNPDYTDTFDQTYNWYPYDSSTTKAEIKNGKFFYTMKGTKSSSEWTLSWPEIKDFYLEVTAKTPDTCDGKDRYGLLFRAPDPSQGYLFYVSCDGQYRLALWDGSNFDILVDWTVANVINKGPNETNRLGVWAEGKKITLYINGEKLIQSPVVDERLENREVTQELIA